MMPPQSRLSSVASPLLLLPALLLHSCSSSSSISSSSLSSSVATVLNITVLPATCKLWAWQLVVGHHTATQQMLLNDHLHHQGRQALIPHQLWQHQGNGALAWPRPRVHRQYAPKLLTWHAAGLDWGLCLALSAQLVELSEPGLKVVPTEGARLSSAAAAAAAAAVAKQHMLCLVAVRTCRKV